MAKSNSFKDLFDEAKKDNSYWLERAILKLEIALHNLKESDLTKGGIMKGYRLVKNEKDSTMIEAYYYFSDSRSYLAFIIHKDVVDEELNEMLKENSSVDVELVVKGEDK